MASQPESFILDSDFPTLKNDNTGSATVVIPGSVSIPGNGSVEFHTDITIGVQGAITRGRIQSSANANKWTVGNAASFNRFGSNSGFGALYNVYIFMWRVNATTLRCQVYLPNPYSSTTTGITSSETINFYVNSFIPPFA